MPPKPLRLWPAVVIIGLYIAVSYGFFLFASTNIQNAIGLGAVPLAAAVLLLLWWLAASRAPWPDRIAGAILFLAVPGCVVLSQKTRGMGAMLLMDAVPAATVGVVLTLLATVRLSWPKRRILLALFLAGCAAVFCSLRVDSIAGNLAPVVSWKWSPTEVERSSTLSAAKTAARAEIPAQATAEDWPAFRGPARDSVVPKVSFSSDWSTPPREMWRRKIGSGWSSFIAVGDYLFTQEQRGEEELVTCYRAATGEEVWANRIKARFDDAMGLGPRATPTFCDGKLYTQGATGMLQCLDAATGDTVWKRDVGKDAGTGVPGYGFCSSPLVVGNLVITFSCGGEGKSVMACNRITGDIAWMSGHGANPYPSPHLATLCGVPQVLMASDLGLQAFVPETGLLLWEHAWKADTNPRCIQPLVLDGERVLLGATGMIGSRVLRLARTDTAWSVSEEWTSKNFRPYFSDCVLHQGNCYGFDGDRLVCLDVNTGKRRWEGKRYSGQLLFFPEMRAVLILSERGEVALVQTVPEAFNELARFKAISGKTWNHPVVSRGRLFVRNAEEAACFDLGGLAAAVKAR